VSTSRRARTIAAAQQLVWEVISDPHHMPRWWPGVDRVEGVEEDRFTQVLRTKKGRPVRADFHVSEVDAPWLFAYEQEILGTPFQRVLNEAVVELRLQGDGDATEVTIVHEQKLRGYSRTGGFMLKRATGRRLDEALDGLERILGGVGDPG
jgi:uncharacterized protein YndB with AHSA1/START domain